MGTHPNGLSTLWEDPQTSLAGLVKTSPESFLGKSLTSGTFNEPGKFPQSTQVPYLFKVLSIAKALPLQAHPDKNLAEKLNEEDRKQFVDNNHKPEIAIALKDGFRGFVGFKELGKIVDSLKSVEELREAIGNEDLISSFIENPTKESLRDVFSALLAAKEDVVKRCVGRLAERVESSSVDVIGDAKLADVIKILQHQYPNDVGVIAAPFFMNLVTLNRGEAIYIGADEAHAYLEGGEYIYYNTVQITFY